MITVTKQDQEAIDFLEILYDDPMRFKKPFGGHTQDLFSIKDDSCDFCEALGGDTTGPDNQCYEVGCDGFGDVYESWYGFGVVHRYECEYMGCGEANPNQQPHMHVTYRYNIPLIYRMTERYPGVA